MEGALPLLKLCSGGGTHTGANYFDIPEGGGAGLTPADKAGIQAAAADAAAANAAAVSNLASIKEIEAQDLNARLIRQVDNITNLRSTVNNRFAASNTSIKAVKLAETVHEKQIASLVKEDAALEAANAAVSERVQENTELIARLRLVGDKLDEEVEKGRDRDAVIKQLTETLVALQRGAGGT